MTNRFCKRVARKMREMGVDAKVAAFFSRFFFLSMLSVSEIMITCMHHRNGVKVLGEETPCSLQHTRAGLLALPNGTSGAGFIIAGTVVADIMPASFRIHRN